MKYYGPLEDRIALRELLEAYSDSVSQRDGEGWAATWLDSDECIWLLPSMAEWAQFTGKKTIVEEWYKMMVQFHGPLEAPWPISFITIPGSIRVDGDIAYVRSYTTEQFVDAHGDTIETKGEYDDVCVKANGQWFFKSRKWMLYQMGDAAKIQVDKA